MKLNFEKQSFEISASNTIIGIISLQIDEDTFFPDKDWNDTVVLILIAWIENVIQIREKKLKEMEFYFFDGPFSFKLMQKQKLTYLEFLRSGKTVLKRHVNFNNVVNSFEHNLLKCSEEVISEIDKKGWITPEVTKLKSLFKELAFLSTH